MNSICVFCGSRDGTRQAYTEAARATGRELARRGITLVYGGGNVGLMGVLADAALEEGGRVVGVIPRALLPFEVGHLGLSELRVVETMHERKAMMVEMSDAFLALPGGIGTLEELFEVWTWAQLGAHRKPCGLLNVAGYFTPLAAFLDTLVPQGFLREDHRAMLVEESDLGRLLRRFETYVPPPVDERLDESRT